MANVAPKAVCDFETKSAVSLKRHGTWRYSTHSSTEILCLCFRLPHWEPGRTSVWHPAMPALGLDECINVDEVEELWDWIAAGKLVEAHNVWFEFCIWQNVLEKRHCWPAIPLKQWRCSAAKAAAHALPRALDKAAEALKIAVRKDMEGAKVMKKMSKPRKSRKKERETWAKEGVEPPKYVWHESVELLERLIAYCRVDVLAEEAFAHVLDDLSEDETELFLMDLAINARGFQIDKHAVQVALRLIYQESVVLNQELTLLTDRQVRKATQRNRMLEWFAEHDLVLFDTQKATIDELLKCDGDSTPNGVLTPTTRRALEIMRELGRSSTAKYKAMKDWMAKDGRVYGGLLYHGASTGRWSGKGIQPHNFPKPTLKKFDGDNLWKCLKRGHRWEIAAHYHTVMEALSSALRGAITASRGNVLYVADYAAIEARVLLWLAQDEDALNVFRTGRDIYLEMASEIYGYPCNKADHPKERQLGKVAVLGLGYQMGASKFAATCDAQGIQIEDEMAVAVVDAYRTKFWRVKALWYDQEAAAVKAVQTGKRVFAGRVVWFTEGRFLFCQLPSGRRLAYPYPQVQDKKTAWGQIKPTLSYWGVNSLTHKWSKQWSYGGLLVENITQAVSRDLMAAAMLRAEESGKYQVVLSVHDELVAEAPKGTGSVSDFEHMMAACPPWAADCPVSAEGYSTSRYRK
jgi:DNA polymerase bacteriophage-type